MLEKVIERQLVKSIKACGGWCIKVNTLSACGFPDRMVLMPNGKIGFVEVKAPGKKPRAIQVKRIKQLRDLGFQCFVVDDVSEIGEILDAIYTS